jgi:N-acetylglucosamine kinase-like BadF-type ATPase
MCGSLLAVLASYACSGDAYAAEVLDLSAAAVAGVLSAHQMHMLW